MKKSNLLITILASLVSFNTFATVYKVKIVKELGPLKHKVIFQSSDLKKIRGAKVLKGKLVVRWGVHVYEVVSGLYACNSKNQCKLTDYERLATYEKCDIISKKKVFCTRKLSGDTSAAADEITYDNGPDSVDDEFSRERNHYDNETEFPVRINDEFDGVF